METLNDFPGLLTWLPGDYTEPPIPEMLIDRMRESERSVVVGIHESLGRVERAENDVTTREGSRQSRRPFVEVQSRLTLEVSRIFDFREGWTTSIMPGHSGAILLEFPKSWMTRILAAKAIVYSATRNMNVPRELWEKHSWRFNHREEHGLATMEFQVVSKCEIIQRERKADRGYGRPWL